MVLIVDDNVSYTERIVEILSEDFQTVKFNTAVSYEDALPFVDAADLQVAMLDINLPGKSGIDLLNYIRKSNKHCKVIMITNQAFDSYRKKCLELGAEHFLDKTSDFEKIPVLLAEMLD
ncbi:response regulator [Lacibacter luteus]|uniref:response regulator n=1 Tax=Lacibacter luteus TaxID=2508719 RepID=UPI0013E98E5D|nr:response regulator [Lacibacter luteus]